MIKKQFIADKSYGYNDFISKLCMGYDVFT